MLANSATLHPSAPGALVFFILTRIFQLFTIQLTDNAFARDRNVLTEGSLTLFPSWPCAMLVHLEDLHPSMLDERVHLLSSGCVPIPNVNDNFLLEDVLDASFPCPVGWVTICLNKPDNTTSLR